jgi:hypothetical protein
MERHSGRKAQRDSKLRWTDCSGLEVDRLLAAASWSHSALSVGEKPLGGFGNESGNAALRTPVEFLFQSGVDPRRPKGWDEHSPFVPCNLTMAHMGPGLPN